MIVARGSEAVVNGYSLLSRSWQQGDCKPTAFTNVYYYYYYYGQS